MYIVTAYTFLYGELWTQSLVAEPSIAGIWWVLCAHNSYLTKIIADTFLDSNRSTGWSWSCRDTSCRGALSFLGSLFQDSIGKHLLSWHATYTRYWPGSSQATHQPAVRLGPDSLLTKAAGRHYCNMSFTVATIISSANLNSPFWCMLCS